MADRPIIEQTDEEMLAELGALTEAKAARTYTAEEERVIAGFEDILRFVSEHDRAPLHGEDRDIFERLPESKSQDEGIDLKKALPHCLADALREQRLNACDEHVEGDDLNLAVQCEQLGRFFRNGRANG